VVKIGIIFTEVIAELKLGFRFFGTPCRTLDGIRICQYISVHSRKKF